MTGWSWLWLYFVHHYSSVGHCSIYSNLENNWFTASGQTWSSNGRLDFCRFVLEFDSESLKSKNLSHKKGPSSYYQSIAIIWIHQFLKMFGPWTICCSGTVVKDRFTMIFYSINPIFSKFKIYLGWIPRNLTCIFKPKMSLLIQNHKNDNQGEFRRFSWKANPIIALFEKKN